MLKTNYHTHSNFCDGKDDVDDIVQEAIKRGFDILGISGHSIFPFAEDWHIAPRDHERYVQEVRAVAQKYGGQITVLCGFEADFIPGISTPSISGQYAELEPDFLIGSVHYILTKNGIFSVDDKTQKVKDGIDRFFGGNGKKCVCEYFAAQREMLKKGDFTILGHADLIRKRNGELHFFDEKDSWYKKELKALAREIKKAGVIAEINSGGMARGAINNFYPSAEFLNLLHENGVPVTYSSDCHQKDQLDFAYEKAIAAAKKAGYTEVAYIDAQKKVQFQAI